MGYVSPTLRGKGWAPTLAPSSLYATSPRSLAQQTRVRPSFHSRPMPLHSTSMPGNGLAAYWTKGQSFFSSRLLGTGMASHLAALYQKVRLTHTAWNGMGAHGCPPQPVCDFSMQLAGHNRHGRDPPFTHATCLSSTSLPGNGFAAYWIRGQDFFSSRHPGTGMTFQREASVASQFSLGCLTFHNRCVHHHRPLH